MFAPIGKGKTYIPSQPFLKIGYIYSQKDKLKIKSAKNEVFFLDSLNSQSSTKI
jgi:hypothetical protein